VMARYEHGDAVVVGSLRGMCEVAEKMKTALRAGDLAEVGTLLSQNWQLQQLLDSRMSTPAMAELSAALTDAGALGGKAAGSGAGGCMFFVAGDDVEGARAAAVRAGAVLLPVSWAAMGVRRC
jgi:galactokinase/mevalonate kinase-like predicted kinase